MNRLKDNQKRLAYPIFHEYPRKFKYYNVIKETKMKYIIEGNIHVSKSTGRELCSNDCGRFVVNLGKYCNEDGSTNCEIDWEVKRWIKSQS